MKRDLLGVAARAFLAAAAAGALWACDAIVGAGDRELNGTITCDDDGCACAEGRADCDGSPDNGCEVDLGSNESCGACGRACENGTCQEYTCVCDAGHGECDGDDATVCETDLLADPLHCGTCERSCAGGACKAGLCDPEPVTSIGPMYAFTLAGKTLYFATNADMGMFRMDLDAGDPQPFGDATQYVDLMHHHGDSVYWTTQDSVYVTSTVTGESVQLASMQAPVARLAVGGDKVYWGDIDELATQLRLHRAPITPGGMVEEVTVLGDASFVFDFAVTEDHVYWADVVQVMRSPHDMIAPALFKNVGTPPTFMQPAPDGILYTGNPGGAYLIPFGVGSTRKLADVTGYGVLTSDAQNVYFVTWVYGSEQPFEVWRAPLTGEGPLVKLAEDPYMFPGAPLGIDDQYLYWIGGLNGEIVRVAK